MRRKSFSSQSGRRTVALKKGQRFPVCEGRRTEGEVSHASEVTTAQLCAGGRKRETGVTTSKRVEMSPPQPERSARGTQSSSLPSSESLPEKFEKFMFEKLKFEKLNSESDIFFLNCSYHSFEKFEFLK